MILSHKSDVRPQLKSLLQNSPTLAVYPKRVWKAPTSHLQECPPGFDAAGAGASLPCADLVARRDSGCLCPVPVSLMSSLPSSMTPTLTHF